MVKLAYSTWGMADVPVEVAVPRLARMGYTGLELTILPGYTTALERLDAAARRRIPALLREHGMTLTALAAHSRLLDPPEYLASITRLREAVHLAVALDPDDPPPIDLNKEIMDAYRPLLRQFYYDETRFETYLEQLGITYPTLTRPISEDGQGSH